MTGGATGGGGSNYTGGYSGTKSIGTTPDSTPPQVAVAVPLPGGFINTATPHIQVTYSDLVGAAELAASGVNPSSLSVVLDGAAITDLFTKRSGDATADIPASRALAAGSHSLQTTVKDYAGNSATASAQFTVDLAAPQIQITQPAAGAYLNTATPAISIQYSDNYGVNLSSLQILINNADLTALFTKTTSGATVTLSAATALPQGANQVVANIKDQAGNQNSASLAFNVDLTRPTISFVQPAPGSYGGSSSVGITVRYSDDQAIDTTTLQVTFDGVPVSMTATPTGATGSVTGAADGSHTLAASINDKAGNQGTATDPFKVDTKAPDIKLVQPAPGALLKNASPQLTVSYSDDQGVNTPTLQVSINGQDYTRLFTVGPGSAAAQLAGQLVLPEGQNTVTASVKDMALNQGTTGALGFTVDTVAPAVTIQSPSAQTNSNTPTVAFSYSDATSGVDLASVHVSVDGSDVTRFIALGPSAATGVLQLSPPLADGNHQLQVTLADRATNPANPPAYPFLVDTVPPRVAFASPANNSFLNSSTPSLTLQYDDGTGTGVDLSSVKVQLQQGANAPVDITSYFQIGAQQATGSIPGSAALVDGTYTLTAAVRDKVGNSSPAQTTFAIDTVPPSYQVVAPAANAYVTTRTPAVQITYQDDSSGIDISKLVLLVDGINQTSVLTITPAGATGTLPSLPDGQHTIQITLVDRAGNATPPPSIPVTFTVATIPPTITYAIAPAANAAGWNNSNATVTFTCTPGTAPLVSCTGPQTVTTEGAKQAVTGAAVDAAGLTATLTATVSLDKTTPTYQVLAPAANAYVTTRTPSIQITYQDSGSGVDTTTLALLVDGTNQTSILAVTPTGATGTLPSLADGQHAVQVTVVDRAGNAAPPVPQTFTVATVPPTIAYAITPSPNAAGWNNSNATVTFTCTPGTAPIAACTGPQAVSTEGANQQVTGTATDAAGYSVPVVASISLDRTPPLLTIASPADGATVASSSLTVSGSVSDSLSGVAAATCNGAAAAVQNGSFSCAVTLASGANQVRVNAVDKAGNGASVALNVTLVVPAPAITNISPAFGPPGTLVILAGTNFGDSQGAGSVTLNGVAVTVASWTATQIVVTVPSGATSGNFVVIAGGQASNPARFTVAVPPQITSLSPTWGPAGTVVTISGSFFGDTQGASTASFNGVPASPITWTATQITAAVPNGASSGPVVVTVGGMASNGVQYNLGQPPGITASVSPAPNAAGWNNWSATVSFTCVAASAPVQSCPPPIVVTTEGAGQVVTGTARDTSGNTAQVSVTLNIDKTPPAITISSPQEGATVSEGNVTINGTIADSLSGLAGNVTCNSAAATLTGSNFTCGATLAVGGNLVSVRAADAAGNASLFRLHLKVPIPPSTIANTLTVTPSYATLESGEVRSFTAVDELGRPRPDAHWSVSDPTVLTPAIDPTSGITYFTAGSTGTTTLSASVGIAIGQAQVKVMAGGTCGRAQPHHNPVPA